MDDPEKPRPSASRLITTGEQRVLEDGARTLIKGVVPHVPTIVKLSLGAMSALLLMVQHWEGKADTENKVRVSYETLAPASIEQAKEIAELKRAVAQLADSVALQARLALASRPGFDDKGKPETPVPQTSRHRHVPERQLAPLADPTIVKKVQEDATKNQELKARLIVDKPAPAVVPAQLPVEVPKPKHPAIPAQPVQEWPPPVPAQTGGAGDSGSK